MDCTPSSSSRVATEAGRQRATSRYLSASEFMLGRIDYERAPKMPYSRRHMNLARMAQLLQLLGNPQDGMKLIHVAGTKGKGSTCAFLCSALASAGYSCGSYTSPHLRFIEERYHFGQLSCMPLEFAAAVESIRPGVEAMDRDEETRPTYFEIATAAAFLLFRSRQVDVGVLEVGLGGRLDSTNICHPLVAVITSISFDHTKQLGNTLGAIAGEKAGIIKPGIPVVSGATQVEAREKIESIAQQNQSPLIQLDRDFKYTNYRWPDLSGLRQDSDNASTSPLDDSSESCWARVDLECTIGDRTTTISDLPLGLVGEHQAANAAVAVATLQAVADDLPISEPELKTGFRTARCEGRIEIVRTEPLCIIDAAHNVASAKALAQTIQRELGERRRLLLLATTLGKDVKGMLQVLLPLFDVVVCTRYAKNPRSWDESKLQRLAQTVADAADLTCAHHITSYASPIAAWTAIRSMATATDLICATGSFFIAGEVRDILL